VSFVVEGWFLFGRHFFEVQHVEYRLEALQVACKVFKGPELKQVHITFFFVVLAMALDAVLFENGL
jgi:hypothetical protein